MAPANWERTQMEKISQIDLGYGQNRITKKAIAWTAELFEGGPLVELRASIELDPMIQSDGEKRLMATTLAIQMDPRVANELGEKIRDLDLTKGWPKPSGAAPQV
jgi:hypothetical protein